MVRLSQPLMLSLASLCLAMRMSKVALGCFCDLPLVLLPLVILQTFWFNHPRRMLFSYDDFLAFGHLGLRWPKQDLHPVKLDYVHFCRELVLVELHLGTFCKFQSSFIYGQLNLSTEDIVIISSMRIRIMSFTICMLLELFR
jgi:hypothetical protein